MFKRLAAWRRWPEGSADLEPGEAVILREGAQRPGRGGLAFIDAFGTLALTDRRLLFKGGPVITFAVNAWNTRLTSIPLPAIEAIKSDRPRAGQGTLTVQTRSGEVGFKLRRPDHWVELLRGQIAKDAQANSIPLSVARISGRRVAAEVAVGLAYIIALMGTTILNPALGLVVVPWPFLRSFAGLMTRIRRDTAS